MDIAEAIHGVLFNDVLAQGKVNWCEYSDLDMSDVNNQIDTGTGTAHFSEVFGVIRCDF